jgi:hypothetical protein
MPPPSPLYYFLRLFIGATSKWHFVLGLPSGRPKIPTTWIPMTLGAHNFACRPSIIMKFEAKLWLWGPIISRADLQLQWSLNKFVTLGAHNFVCRPSIAMRSEAKLWLWGPITSHVDLQLQWGLEQSCSPHRELSNGMLHATYMLGNQVNSRLLKVGSQTGNLTPDLSFDHNLCFRCLNGSCKPILDS